MNKLKPYLITFGVALLAVLFVFKGPVKVRQFFLGA